MNTSLKSNLLRMFLLIILIFELPLGYGVNAKILSPSEMNTQTTGQTVNVITSLANSTFYSNNSLRQFSDSIQLNVTPSNGVDLNVTGIDYMIILDASGSMNTNDVAPTRYISATNWVNQFVSTLRPIDRLSMIIFNTNSALQFNFTTMANTIASNAMNNAVPTGTANVGSAISMAISEYSNDSTPATPKMIYMLTDGPYSSGTDPCNYATQFKAMHAKTYINDLGVWDASNDACLLENSTTDIMSNPLYDSTVVKNNLDNFGNLTGTNIELHLDMNNNLIFTYSYGPDSSMVSGNVKTAIWNYNELRMYYYEDHLNFSIGFTISGIGSIPVYYGTSYLTYTSSSNSTVKSYLNELNVTIINPDTTNLISTSTGSSNPTSSTTNSANQTSSKGLDFQPLFGLLGILFLSTYWRRKKSNF